MLVPKRFSHVFAISHDGTWAKSWQEGHGVVVAAREFPCLQPLGLVELLAERDRYVARLSKADSKPLRIWNQHLTFELEDVPAAGLGIHLSKHLKPIRIHENLLNSN